MSVMYLIKCPVPNFCLLLGELQSILQMLVLVLLIGIKEKIFLYCFLERICFFLNSPSFFLQIIQITSTPPVFPPSPSPHKTIWIIFISANIKSWRTWQKQQKSISAHSSLDSQVMQKHYLIIALGFIVLILPLYRKGEKPCHHLRFSVCICMH